MPIESYQEVTSHYWNLIYRQSVPEHTTYLPTERNGYGAARTAATPTSRRISVAGIENEYNRSLAAQEHNPVIAAAPD